jgi:hypothetical protein
MRDVYDNIAVGGYTVLFSTTTSVVATGASVDTKGYNSAALRVYIGTVGAGLTVNNGSSLTAVLQESTDNVTFTTATDNTGATIGFTGTQATTSVVLAAARIEGLNTNRQRYLRVQLTAKQGGTSGTVANAFTSAAVIELGRAYQRPVTTTVSNT